MKYNFLVKFKNLKSTDFEDCAKIHNSEIKGGLLKYLGKKFLTLLYKNIFYNKNAFLIILKNNNNVIGFFAGCFNQKKFYISFIKNNLFQLLLISYNLINIGSISKLTALNSFFTKKNTYLPNSSILNFCIKKKFQSKGFGKILLKRSIKIFKSKKIRSIQIRTGINQKKAINMYSSFGAIKQLDKNLIRNKNNVIFILHLKK